MAGGARFKIVWVFGEQMIWSIFGFEFTTCGLVGNTITRITVLM